MSLKSRLAQPKLLISAILLGTMLPTSFVSASNSSKRLTVFVSGGRSRPVGEFNGVAKSGFNWGGGVELRFRSHWASGLVVRRVELQHQDVWYDSWLQSWRYTDWTFLRSNWYVKYILRKKGLSPFLKAGLGIYSMESKRTLVGKTQATSHTSGFSVTPGLGVQYSAKRVLFFIETQYNAVLRKSLGGDTASNRVAQFFDFSFGAGFFLGRQR